MKKAWWITNLFCFLLISVSGTLDARRTPGQFKQELINWLKEPEILAFLDVIAFAEGTFRAHLKGYKMRYTGATFSSYKEHPAIIICAPLNGRRICSTASGRYQFLLKTWNKIAHRLDLNDFSPLNQDIAAAYLLFEKKVLQLIKNNEFEKAVYKMNDIWASFPGSPFGQPTKKIAPLRRIFDERLAHYQKAGIEPVQINQPVLA
jgi:muramidase (phage lysozyme)